MASTGAVPPKVVTAPGGGAATAVESSLSAHVPLATEASRPASSRPSSSHRKASAGMYMSARQKKAKERRQNVSAAHADAAIKPPPGNEEKLEDGTTVETLKKLKRQFLEADEDGNGTLELDEFIVAFRGSLGRNSSSDDELTALFLKIDVSNDGRIDWDEFATFMLLEFQKRSDAVLRAKQVPIVLPARAVPSPHRGVLANARIGANGRLLTLGQDGAMAVWKPSRRGITPMKELRMELQSRTAPGGTKSWATDFAPLLQMHKIVVASGQRELWFYDLRTMQPSFVVTQLEETPLRLDCAYDEQARATVVIVGDHKGTLAALTFPDFYESAQAFRGMGSADPTKDVLRVSLGTIQGGGADLGGVTYTRWAVHNDWVVGLVYAASLRAIISASNDEATALVVGDILRPATAAPKTLDIDPEGDMAFMFQTTGMRRNPKQRSFFIPRGCKAMCFSDARCMVATGGLDRTIRVWNPYVNANPSGLLKGHCSPILALCIDDGPGRLYSSSSDGEVKIWDLAEFLCLKTIIRRRHEISGELQFLAYLPTLSLLLVFSDQLFNLGFGKEATLGGEAAKSHALPVLCCLYNARFQHVLTACAGGIVKVWEAQTGAPIFEFECLLPGDEEAAAITSFVLDATSGRLITGQTNGRVTAWNYNNGQRLRSFDQGSTKEITALVYAERGQLKNVVSVGWSRRVSVFKDKPEEDLAAAAVRPETERWAQADRHADDIQVLAYCPPALLASASFDGAIFIWNMTSASVTAKIPGAAVTANAPVSVAVTAPDGSDAATTAMPSGKSRSTFDNPALDEMLAQVTVNSLCFLPGRIGMHDAAALVAGCGGGRVCFWNIYRSRLLGEFHAGSDDTATITSLLVVADGQHLVTGDSRGWVRIWDVGGYCTKPHDNGSPPPPPLAREWRGHLSAITSLVCMAPADGSTRRLLSSSADGRVRMWTLAEGGLVGTFGQSREWALDDDETFQHPGRPAEIVQLEESLVAAAAREAKEEEDLAERVRRASWLAETTRRIQDEKDAAAEALYDVTEEAEEAEEAEGSETSGDGAGDKLMGSTRGDGASAEEEAGSAAGGKSAARPRTAPAFERLSDRGTGNWSRHMVNLPHRPLKDKVYLSLPYHDLGTVTVPPKPKLSKRGY